LSDEGKYRPHQLIRDAARHGELVVFIGAGASKLCGSPSWQEFAYRVVSALEGASHLSFLEAEQLRNLGDNRRTLSIALDLAREYKLKIDFDTILHPVKPSQEGLELYGLLTRLRPVFLTTNYDRWLGEELPELAAESGAGKESLPTASPSKRARYYLKKDLSPEKLVERGAVIHLHGCYIEPDSMVVSLKDYIEHYADPKVQTFLSEMFKNYTVLFVGYGLAELEVLEYIIRSDDRTNKGKSEPRHFLLYPHRSTEKVQKGFIERFFHDQCGIHVIPYCIDGKGYGELVEVFRAWAPQLDMREPTTLELQAQIDRCVLSGNEIHRESAIRLIKAHPHLSSYFLNSLNDLVWFDDLDGAGFFEVGLYTDVNEVEDGSAIFHQTDSGPALRYLEGVVSQANEVQAARIANIVRQVSRFIEEKGRNNWRALWSLATILSKLPVKEIKKEDIEMCRSWLLSRFGGDMVGQELGEHLLPRLLDSDDVESTEKALLLVDVLSMLKPKESV